MKIIKGLGIALASILLTFVIAEYVVGRFFSSSVYIHWAVEDNTIFRLDDELIYSLKPNSKRIFETAEFIETVSINSLGLRDKEIPQQKKGQRILVLGDSYTFGHGVSNEDSYPKQLERQIKTSWEENVEVINAGVKGYNLDQEYKLFTTRLIELDPDIVLITLGESDFSCSNIRLYDITDVNSLVPLNAKQNWLYMEGYRFQRAPRFLQTSALYRLIISTLSETQANRYPPDCKEQSYRKSLQQIKNISQMNNSNSQVIVVFYPIPRATDQDQKELQEFKTILESSKIFYIDTNNFNWDPYRFPLDTHLNISGNTLFAEKVSSELYNFLQSRKENF